MVRVAFNTFFPINKYKRYYVLLLNYFTSGYRGTTTISINCQNHAHERE